jgi:hypothetical protein
MRRSFAKIASGLSWTLTLCSGIWNWVVGAVSTGAFMCWFMFAIYRHFNHQLLIQYRYNTHLIPFNTEDICLFSLFDSGGVRSPGVAVSVTSPTTILISSILKYPSLVLMARIATALTWETKWEKVVVEVEVEVEVDLQRVWNMKWARRLHYREQWCVEMGILSVSVATVSCEWSDRVWIASLIALMGVELKANFHFCSFYYSIDYVCIYGMSSSTCIHLYLPTAYCLRWGPCTQ